MFYRADVDERSTNGFCLLDDHSGAGHKELSMVRPILHDLELLPAGGIPVPQAVRCGAVRCGAVRCGAVRYGTASQCATR